MIPFDIDVSCYKTFILKPLSRRNNRAFLWSKHTDPRGQHTFGNTHGPSSSISTGDLQWDALWRGKIKLTSVSSQAPEFQQGWGNKFTSQSLSPIAAGFCVFLLCVLGYSPSSWWRRTKKQFVLWKKMMFQIAQEGGLDNRNWKNPLAWILAQLLTISILGIGRLFPVMQGPHLWMASHSWG
jgi:hypothetical protein